MALPLSGSLSIKDAAGTLRSIAREVDGNVTGNKSLLSLSTSAGVNGCMTAFYGYSAGIDVSMGMQWTGGGGFGNGFNGTVRLRCSTTTVCSCSFPLITTSALINWGSIPAGTYYVDFALIQANVDSVGVLKQQCWITNASNGTSDQTNTFSTSQSIDYTIWSGEGGGDPF